MDGPRYKYSVDKTSAGVQMKASIEAFMMNSSISLTYALTHDIQMSLQVLLRNSLLEII